MLKPGGILKCDMPHFSLPLYHWDGDHKRCGHSKIFHAYIEPVGDKGMDAMTKGNRFELVDFDFTMRGGSIFKPIVRKCFAFYEDWLANKLLYIWDIRFTLKKVKKEKKPWEDDLRFHRTTYGEAKKE